MKFLDPDKLDVFSHALGFIKLNKWNLCLNWHGAFECLRCALQNMHLVEQSEKFHNSDKAF